MEEIHKVADLDNLMGEVDVVGIDEGQFYDDITERAE